MPSRRLQFEDRDGYMVCDEKAMHIALRDHKKEPISDGGAGEGD